MILQGTHIKGGQDMDKYSEITLAPTTWNKYILVDYLQKSH